jgi:hypothetical protein
VTGKPTLGRRSLAAAVDLYNFCYVALLPLVIVGAFVVFREERVIHREIARARAMPKGVWKEDPARMKELDHKRGELFKGIGRDLKDQVVRFLDSLAPRLDEDQKFKDRLDSLIKHPYTDLVSDTVDRGLSALKRHARAPEGKAALERVERFVKDEMVLRVFRHIREELDYRVGQIADYLGFHHIGERIRALMRAEVGSPGAPPSVPEALHWTNLVDKVIEEKVDILPETRANLELLRATALAAGVLALVYLALRDLVGRGRSFGKRAAGLRIVDAGTGGPASARQMAVRGVLLVALLPLELLLAAFDRRIGDRVAGTRLEVEGP